MSILANCSARVNFAKWKGSTAEDMNYLANMAEDKESLANQLGSFKGSEQETFEAANLKMGVETDSTTYSVAEH